MTDALEGDLNTVSDSEWLWAHERLALDLAEVAPSWQLDYEWTARQWLPPADFFDGDGEPPRAIETEADAGDVRRMQAIITMLRTDYGVEVLEVPGWQTRGATWSRVPCGIIDHHDASSRASGEWGSLGVIRDGRPGIPGPLCQFQTGRGIDGKARVAVVAAGRANHAGTGGPILGIPADAANAWLYGAEAANDGVSEPYTDAQHRARDCLFRAVLRACGGTAGLPVSRVIGHREWAPRRKVDPRYSMDWRRSTVGAIQPPQPARRISEDTVAIVQLPATPAPAAGIPRAQWPQREEVVALGMVGGWHGRVVLRAAVGHPGGRIHRAHVDYPGKAVKVEHWVPVEKPLDVEGPYMQPADYIYEPTPIGPASLMITYSAPGGLSLNVEYEK